MAESIVVCLCPFEVGSVMEAEVVPARGIFALVPTGRARRTHQNALQSADH
jgi:hypothetical protein